MARKTHCSSLHFPLPPFLPFRLASHLVHPRFRPPEPPSHSGSCFVVTLLLLDCLSLEENPWMRDLDEGVCGGGRAELQTGEGAGCLTHGGCEGGGGDHLAVILGGGGGRGGSGGGEQASREKANGWVDEEERRQRKLGSEAARLALVSRLCRRRLLPLRDCARTVPGRFRR